MNVRELALGIVRSPFHAEVVVATENGIKPAEESMFVIHDDKLFIDVSGYLPQDVVENGTCLDISVTNRQS